LKVLEEHPSEAAALTTDALWCVVGDYGQRGRHGLASAGVAR
jgi:hypothetical protein